MPKEIVIWHPARHFPRRVGDVCITLTGRRTESLNSYWKYGREACGEQPPDTSTAMARIANKAFGRAQRIVDLDEDRKAQMVSNLLVVLCSENETTPVVNMSSP